MQYLIEFLGDASSLQIATKAQRATYQLLHRLLVAESRNDVTVDEVVAALSIPVNCLFSRLEHLEEKGLITLKKSQMATA